jgi:S1-C subfamily serine protease
MCPTPQDRVRLGVQVELRAGAELRSVITTEPGFFEYLGLQQGDQLIDANGEPLSTLDDLSSAFLGLRPDQALAVNIERGGSKTTLRYSAVP